LYDNAPARARPGAAATRRPDRATPCRAWNSQNEVSAASLRFTLAALQWCSTEGSTAILPARAAGGNRSHATNPATSSRSTARQSVSRPVRKTNQSFRSWAYALTVFGDRSTDVK